jgi:hypothetical protein
VDQSQETLTVFEHSTSFEQPIDDVPSTLTEYAQEQPNNTEFVKTEVFTAPIGSTSTLEIVKVENLEPIYDTNPSLEPVSPIAPESSEDDISPLAKKVSKQEQQKDATTNRPSIPPINFPNTEEKQKTRATRGPTILRRQRPEVSDVVVIPQSPKSSPKSSPSPKQSPKESPRVEVSEPLTIEIKSPRIPVRVVIPSNEQPKQDKSIEVPNKSTDDHKTENEEMAHRPHLLPAQRRHLDGRTMSMAINRKRKNSLAKFSQNLRQSIQVGQNGSSGHQDLLRKLNLVKFNDQGEVVDIIQEKPTVDQKTLDAQKVLQNAIGKWHKLNSFRAYLITDGSLRNQRLRIATMKEIHSTELTYVFNLKTLITEYKTPLMKMKIISDNEAATIFGNVDMIYNINQQILNSVHAEFMKWPICNLGAAFKIIAPFLKTYTDYINGYDIGSQMVQDLMSSNKKFADFTNTVYTRRNLSIQSLLVLPVQRLPRYKLLFQQLLEKTVPNHVDFQDLNYCLKLVTDLSAFVNEKKRTLDLSSSLVSLQRKLDARFKNLLQPYRQFQRKGKLQVACSRKLLDEWAYVYLFNDMILVLPLKENMEDDEQTILENGFVSSKVEAIFLMFAKIEHIDANSFKLDAFSRTSSFGFKFSSPEPIHEWKILIERLIQNLKKKISDRGINLQTEQIECKRLNEYNRIKVTELKLEKSEQELTDTKNVVFKIDRAMRDAQNEIIRLNEFVEQKKEEGKKAQAQVEIVKGRHKELKADYEKSKANLEAYDLHILNSVLNHDIAAFRELFASDPTCIVQDLSSYVSPDDITNLPEHSTTPQVKTVKPIPESNTPRIPSRPVLVELTRTGDSETFKLPSNEGVIAALPFVPKFSGSSLKRNNSSAKPFRKLTVLEPPPSPAHISRHMSMVAPKTREVSFDLPKSNSENTVIKHSEEAPPSKPKPLRISIKTREEIERNNPYVVFEQAKPKTCVSLETITSNKFVRTLNKLYRLRPLKCWGELEQEALSYKYVTDRARFGSHIIESEPVPYADDMDSEFYFDDDDDDELPIFKLEMLPNNVEVLKQMVLNLQKQVKT